MISALLTLITVVIMSATFTLAADGTVTPPGRLSLPLPNQNSPTLPKDLPEHMRHELESGIRTLAAVRAPEGFFGTATVLPPRVEQGMRAGKGWKEGCPVPLGDLAYLVVRYHGRDGSDHYGELVVHAKLAGVVLDALREIYEEGYRIDKMRLIEEYDGLDDRSTIDNNTSAFNCREVPDKPGVLSRHSYGTAIDINPVQNPFLTLRDDALKGLGWDGRADRADFLTALGYPYGRELQTFCQRQPAACRIDPPRSAAFLQRDGSDPAILRENGGVVRAFTKRGFQWGGSWRHMLDYQHFDYPPERLGMHPGTGKIEQPVEDHRATEAPVLDSRAIQHPVFDAGRLRLTADYALRHYGERSWRMETPRMIVVHYTAIPTLKQTLDFFQPSLLDRQSRSDIAGGGEVNVSAHYLVEESGGLYQLAPEDVICRHTIGFNQTAIGIENIAANAAGLTEAQAAASAALISRIVARHPSIRFLIGHHEYRDRTLPHYALYRELDPTYRFTDKIDPGPAFMNRVRQLLSERYGITLEK